MNPAKRLAINVADRLDINRPFVVRWLTRYGSPRLRELRAEARAARGLGPRAFRRVERWLERGDLSVQTGRAGGLRFALRHLPLSHPHIGAIAFGDLESSVQEAIVRHLAPDGVFYDVGANIGFFSMLAARLAPEGIIYAFDPAPDNAEAVRINAQVNGAGNVIVLVKAAGAQTGRARLQVVEDQSWSKLEEYGSHADVKEVIDVDVVAIDDLVRSGELRPPTLVKIDVEGAELSVIEGMAETIAAHRPAIVCELHGTEEPFLARMSELGYRIVNLEGAAPIGPSETESRALALPPLDPAD